MIEFFFFLYSAHVTGRTLVLRTHVYFSSALSRAAAAMAIPPPTPPSVVAAVDEITRIYRSLPPRPPLDEVEAAVAVLSAADREEEARLEEVSRAEKPPDVPDELFFVLQEARRNLVRLQAQAQRREAERVADLDARLQVFDDLLQRASRLVSGDGGDGEDVLERERERRQVVVPAARIERKLRDPDAGKGVARASSLKFEASSGGEGEKLSLIKVANLIETSAKSGAGVLDLQGKLTDDIEWLPLSLGKLQNTTDLNLSENRIVALPPTVGHLRFLTKLDLHSNQLINLPDSFGELSNLMELDLRGNRLKSLPVTFGNLSSLADLDLSSNQLSMLPDTVGNLTKLRKLNLETNELEELPYTIGSWSSLVELRLDFNQLKALPEAIGKLECLEVMTLHYNRIKSLPTTMGSLSKIKELDVSFNELESIPESLCFATSLVKLNVGRNFADLRTLPRSIGNLEMLEELDISANQIRALPESFRFLSKLRVFYADETPLEVPPRQVIKLGAEAVVQYMADLVAARDISSQPAEKTGFWLWLCSLFQPSKKIKNSGVDPKTV